MHILPRMLIPLLTALSPTALPAQTAQDSAGIRGAALDYIEGWYSGNGDRMAKALHPELAKRIMLTDTLGNFWIRDMGATELIRGTRTGGGTRTPEADRRTEVRVLDIFQNAASVRIDAAGGSTTCTSCGGAASGSSSTCCGNCGHRRLAAPAEQAGRLASPTPGTELGLPPC